MPVLLKYKNIIFVVTILFIVGVVGKGIYFKYLDQDKAIEGRRAELDGKKVVAARLASINREIEEFEIVFLDGDIFHFQRMADNMAKESKIRIKSFKPKAAGGPDVAVLKYKKIDVILNVMAGYKGLSKFIKALEETGAVEIHQLRKEEGVAGFYLALKVLLKK